MTRNESLLPRRLAAIFYADVVGYSRLSERAEERTHRLLSDALDRIAGEVRRYGGEVRHYAGDAVLAEFPAVVMATACALSVHRALESAQADIPAADRVRFRVGINLGEVIVDRGEIWGTGVNVAARLEALAEPGGVCVSEPVRRELHGLLPVAFTDMGVPELKNISDPVHAFGVRLRPGAEVPPPPALPGREARHGRRQALRVGVGLLVGVALAAALWLSRGPPAPAPEEPPAIAVLPFENLNRDPDQDYFVDGLTDDLITDLARHAGLVVIARGSSAGFRDGREDDRTVARALGVRFLVRGTMRRTPTALRVNATLVDADSGESLWAERYDVEPSRVFDLQERIVAGILDVLLPRGPGTPSRNRAVDLEAYDLFLQGWAHYQRETPEGWGDAIPLLQAAAAADTGFARPHAVLAAIHYLGRLRHWHARWGLTSHQAWRAAYEHMARATREPDALGLSIRALMHAHNGRHDSAVTDARAALRIEPSSPTAHIVLAEALAYAGRAPEALEHAEGAMRLNPRSPASYPWTAAVAHFVGGDLSAAKSFFERAGFDHPGVDLTPAMATYALLGETDRAAALVALQRQRWSGHNPAHPLTARALVAAFPPLARGEDVRRLREGVERALAIASAQ